MDLVIDTSGITFQVGRGFEARLDKDGVHRRDKAGRTTDNPPKVTQGMSVRPERLQAMPWVQNGTNAVKVAYRADAVVPVTSANRPAPAPSGS